MKEQERKPYRITIRLSMDEYGTIKERAKKVGIPLSKYMRKTSLNTELHEKPSDDFLKVLWKIDRIGININQITAKVNTYDYLEEKELKKEIEELRNLTKEIRNKYLGSG